MTKKDREIIREVIGESIKIHVNGKIDKMHKKLDDYIVADMAWKEKAEPVIKMGENAVGASKVMLYLTMIISAVGGAYLIIKNIFR